MNQKASHFSYLESRIAYGYWKMLLQAAWHGYENQMIDVTESSTGSRHQKPSYFYNQLTLVSGQLEARLIPPSEPAKS